MTTSQEATHPALGVLPPILEKMSFSTWIALQWSRCLITGSEVLRVATELHYGMCRIQLIWPTLFEMNLDLASIKNINWQRKYKKIINIMITMTPTTKVIYSSYDPLSSWLGDGGILSSFPPVIPSPLFLSLCLQLEKTCRLKMWLIV